MSFIYSALMKSGPLLKGITQDFFAPGNDPPIPRLPLENQAGSGVTVSVPLGSLTLTAYAPTAVVPRTVQVPLGSLTLTGFAPSVLLPKNISVPLGSLILSGFAPTISVGAGVTVDVPLATLTLTGLVPAVVTPRLVSVPLGSMALTAYAPVVSGGGEQAVAARGGDDVPSRWRKNPNRGFDLEEWRRRNAIDESMADTLRAAIKNIHSDPVSGNVLDEVRELTKPFERPAKKKSRASAPPRIDWSKLSLDVERAARIVEIEQLRKAAKMEEEEDDDEILFQMAA